MLNPDASIRDYQEYLEKTILKLNYKSFTQIVVLGSSTFIPFMQLKASDRRTIIEDLLDIEIFSVMNQLLRARVGQNKDDMGTVDIKLGLSNGEFNSTQHLIQKLKENKSIQISKNKKDIKQHEKHIKEYQESNNEPNREIEEYVQTISDEKTVRSEINKLLD